MTLEFRFLKYPPSPSFCSSLPRLRHPPHLSHKSDPTCFTSTSSPPHRPASTTRTPAPCTPHISIALNLTDHTSTYTRPYTPASNHVHPFSAAFPDKSCISPSQHLTNPHGPTPPHTLPHTTPISNRHLPNTPTPFPPLKNTTYTTTMHLLTPLLLHTCPKRDATHTAHPPDTLT